MHDAYMLAPTDRSMPATSSTKVMPIAMIAMCAAWVTMLMKLLGVRKRSDSEPKTASSTRNSSSGAYCSASMRSAVGVRAHAAAPLTPSHMARRRMASRSKPRALELAPDLAVAHDQDAVAHADQLLDLRGDHQDAGAVGGEPVDDLVDLVLGADVDAAGRLVEDEQARAAQQPLADHHLLLVAAGQVLDQRADEVAGVDLHVAAGPLDRVAQPRALEQRGPSRRRSAAARAGAMLSAIGAPIIRPSARRSSVRKAMPRSMAACGVGRASGAPSTAIVPRGERVEAEQDAGQSPSGPSPSGRPRPRPRPAAPRSEMSLTTPGWVRPLTSSTGVPGRAAGSRGG